MKHYINIYFLLASFFSYSQNNYPIQTILKGDSVVILNIDQYRDIEIMSENQKSRIRYMKSQIEYFNKVKDSLDIERVEKIDSLSILNKLVENNLSNYDSLQNKIKLIESFLYESAIDNSYLYYSYTDSTIMLIDMSSYIFIGNKKTGNFALVRRGFASEDIDFKKYNRLYPQEPESGWELYYKEKWRPVVIPFPYKIKNKE